MHRVMAVFRAGFMVRLLVGLKAGGRQRWQARTACALAAVPLVALIAMAGRYNVDVPHWDQWDFVPLLEQAWTGEPVAGALWDQHNEHRLVFPRLVMLALARVSAWNTRWECAFSILCAVGIFILLGRFARRSVSLSRAWGWWLFPVFSCFVFSPSQWQNWYLGWQLQIFMSIAAFLGAITLLAADRPSWGRVAGAACCGILATFSFANGLLVWPLALLVMAPGLRGAMNGRIRLQMAAWLMLAALVTVAYFAGYEAPTHSSGTAHALRHPILWAQYVLKYLGSPLAYMRHSGTTAAKLGTTIARHNTTGLIFGAVGIALWLWALFRWLRYGLPLRDLAPLVAVGGYAALSGGLAGWGRLGLSGTQQALDSRYITIANLFWVSGLAALAATAGPLLGRRWVAGLRYAGLALIVALLARSGFHGWVSWSERTPWLEEARAALVAGEPEPTLGRLYPRPGVVQTRRETLRQLKTSVFRD